MRDGLISQFIWGFSFQNYPYSCDFHCFDFFMPSGHKRKDCIAIQNGPCERLNDFASRLASYFP